MGVGSIVNIVLEAFPYLAAVAALPAAYMALNFLLSPPKTNLLFVVLLGFFSVVWVFIWSVALFSLVPIAWHYTDHLAVPILQSPWAGVIFAVTIIFVYRFRERRPLLYGTVEIYVGLAALATVSQHQGAELSLRILSLLGASFITVRGMDNIKKGLSDESRETLWELLFPPKFARRTDA